MNTSALVNTVAALSPENRIEVDGMKVSVIIPVPGGELIFHSIENGGGKFYFNDTAD